MRILFDHNVPRRFRQHIVGHRIQTTGEMGWEALENGLLLKAAGDAPFDAFLCIDKNIEYQQNLKLLPLPVVVLDAPSNAIQNLVPLCPHC